MQKYSIIVESLGKKGAKTYKYPNKLDGKNR